MTIFADKRLRTYLLLLFEGVFFTVALVFFDGNTILPLLVYNLTGSSVLVGLIGMAPHLGAFVASLFAANLIRTMPYKRKFVLVGSSLGRLPIWLAAGLMFVVSVDQWWLAALVVVVVKFLFWFVDGLVGIAWVDLMGKSIESHQRGRFFAIIQVSAGLIAVFAGGLVRQILELKTPGFPGNYGILFILAAFLFSTTILVFLFVEEKPSPVMARDRTWDFIKNIPGYFLANRLFARAMAVSVLHSMLFLSMPFFVVFGQTQLGFSQSDVGFFLSAQIMGGIVGGMLWGWIGDRWGHHRGILTVCSVTSAPPVIALLTGLLLPASIAFAAYLILFFLVGMHINGWPTFLNYTLDVVPAAERTLYTGLMNMVRAPVALAPVLGGILATWFGYYTLFVLTSILLGIAVYMAVTLAHSQTGIRLD